ncbi:MAG TPA: hypothetical protein PKV38_20430, partial [bacterium]|nr:hypothetical protein [bacterium]
MNGKTIFIGWLALFLLTMPLPLFAQDAASPGASLPAEPASSAPGDEPAPPVEPLVDPTLPAGSADTTTESLPAPIFQTGEETATGPRGETTSSGGFDSTLAQANQAFMALMSRQFPMALQGFKAAASANNEYQKMVDFCQNIIDRLQDLYKEQIDIYGKMMAPDFRTETLSKEEIDRMLNFQMRQLQAGQTLGELGLIADIPVSDLGLDFEGADQTSLAEYLGWIRPRSANERIWQRARKRALERALVYAKQEIRVQQRQDQFQRVEEYRRR